MACARMRNSGSRRRMMTAKVFKVSMVDSQSLWSETVRVRD